MQSRCSGKPRPSRDCRWPHTNSHAQLALDGLIHPYKLKARLCYVSVSRVISGILEKNLHISPGQTRALVAPPGLANFL